MHVSARSAPIWCWRAAPSLKPSAGPSRSRVCALPMAPGAVADASRRCPMNRPTGRDLKVRVRTGKGRTLAQKRWLERQLNDPYVARAKREGYRSRAAYKLIEIDDKHHILKPGAKVIDLGAGLED